MAERTGKRKPREEISKRRVPELGYYFVVTDARETEQNYMHGLRDSIPKAFQGKLVIKVIKSSLTAREKPRRIHLQQLRLPQE